MATIPTPETMVSILEPSKFARWRLLKDKSLLTSVQYILPPATSKARPFGMPTSVTTMVSILDPSKFARWIL